MERSQQAATKGKLKKSAAVTFEDTVSMHPNPDISLQHPETALMPTFSDQEDRFLPIMTISGATTTF